MRKIRKEEERKSNKHIAKLMLIGYVSTALLLALIGRLFYLQIIKHDYYSNEIQRQKQFTIPVDIGRGEILDRNNIPLVNREENRVLIVFPHLFISSEKNIETLSELTNISKEQIYNRVNSTLSPIEFPITKNIDWQDRRIVETRGIFIVDKLVRYSNDQILSHVIGYIHNIDRKGLSGIEMAYNSILSGAPNKSVIAILDGRKRIIPGEGLRIVNNTLDRKNVRLTIDYRIQKISEEVFDESEKFGAIIISDVKTGEILAMASRPSYNPNSIRDHLFSSGDELFNKAIQMTFPPGSVFKLVLAAEAIERQLVYPQELFFCDGVERIGNHEIKCNSFPNGGHGEITFETAFAKSCNSAFIQLGRRLGAENIINMAKRLGLGAKTNIGIIEEEAGVLPSGDQLLGPVIGNISIGQGEIDVTPIQINQMTQIIANDGIKQPLRLVKDIVDSSYNTLEKIDIEESREVISQSTAKEIQTLMNLVMQEGGTGSRVGDLNVVTAGKTGTAESSYRNMPVLHAWFTGYYPLEEPKYAITVFVQDGKSGGRVAVPIFRDIIKRIIEEEI